MRRSLAAVLMIASLTLVACAQPTEDPLPGQSTTVERTTSSPPTTSAEGDETAAVCTEALDVSDQAETDLTAQMGDVQDAIAANDQSAAIAAAGQARQTATGWKEDLERLAARPIDDSVREVLGQGIDLIDGVLGTQPQDLDADQVRSDVQGFLDDLDRVCG